MVAQKASNHYDVPKTTLYRFVRRLPPSDAMNIKLGRRSVLPPEIEDELVRYCELMEYKFYGLTASDVCNMAYQLVDLSGIRNPFSVGGKAGKTWFKLFAGRHKEVLRIMTPTRSGCFRKELIDQFFRSLGEEFDKNQYTPDRIFNVSEIAMSVVQIKLPHVICLRNKQQISGTSVKKGLLITLVLCMSAAGYFVPPLVIFPFNSMKTLLMKGAPPGSISACHPSGWIQTNMFTSWCKHFLDNVKPTSEYPILLILDGSNSHTRNIEVMKLAQENHVTIICLPPNSAHNLQPLDVSVMSQLKNYYGEEVTEWSKISGRNLTHFDLAELFGRAYSKVINAQLTVESFEKTGIYPLDRSIFGVQDFRTPSKENEENVPSDDEEERKIFCSSVNYLKDVNCGEEVLSESCSSKHVDTNILNFHDENSENATEKV